MPAKTCSTATGVDGVGDLIRFVQFFLNLPFRYPMNFLHSSGPAMIIDLNYAEIAAAIVKISGRSPGLHELTRMEDQIFEHSLSAYLRRKAPSLPFPLPSTHANPL